METKTAERIARLVNGTVESITLHAADKPMPFDRYSVRYITPKGRRMQKYIAAEKVA